MRPSPREISCGGFPALELSNDKVSVAVIPGLGAKIMSLRNAVSGREWCWHPGKALDLFSNAYGDSFALSPHAGIDECFPTIEGCREKGRDLSCHGEVWSESWEVDQDAWQNAVIATRVTCRQSPFHLARRLSLEENCVRLEYSVENRGPEPERFLWAWHPLLRIAPEDRIELPPEVTALRIEAAQGSPANDDGAIWSWPSPFPNFQLDRFHLGDNRQSRFKGFTGALSEGWARLRNEETGDRLELRWDPGQNPFLGIWMTRGGYRGWHGVGALEPTNVPSDFLEKAKTFLPPGETRRWRLTLQITN